MENQENSKLDKLQSFGVPKVIKVLSLVYIILSVIYGFVVIVKSLFVEWHSVSECLQYVMSVFSHVISGFLFWGVGQVFEKIMGKNK